MIFSLFILVKNDSLFIGRSQAIIFVFLRQFVRCHLEQSYGNNNGGQNAKN